jgi:hypothetical protein
MAHGLPDIRRDRKAGVVVTRDSRHCDRLFGGKDDRVFWASIHTPGNMIQRPNIAGHGLFSEIAEGGSKPVECPHWANSVDFAPLRQRTCCLAIDPVARSMIQVSKGEH